MESSAQSGSEGVPDMPKRYKKPVVVIVLGMAGSGKTTLMQRIALHANSLGLRTYHINLDPAVKQVPFGASIDIRDTVNYKEVMSQYGLGPNGGIMTSLNLFATRFDQVLGLLEKRAGELDYVFVDTPGQIEVFTWSASGQIITDTLASSFPTCLCYVVDTPRTVQPTTFMSNMLYACSVLYKSRLPMVLTFNKTDITPSDFAGEWMSDFEKFQTALDSSSDSDGYMGSLNRSLSLVLDEFYNTLRHVGVSAATGDGMDTFFTKIDEAADEFVSEYLPDLQQRMAKAKSDREAAHNQNMEKLQAGLSEIHLRPKARQQQAPPHVGAQKADLETHEL
jgi:GTPase SAR1 family protein